MKRSFIVGEDQVECLDSASMANVLMLLSRAGEEFDAVTARPTSPARVFECKTCSRQFPSFQALGGHRASHKKPRLADGHAQLELAKPRVHECSICGLEFAIGQALGGHMRRHRAALAEGLAAAHGPRHGRGLGETKQHDVDDKRTVWLDLNMLPADQEEAAAAAGECRHKIFGFELVDTAPMVDWLH